MTNTKQKAQQAQTIYADEHWTLEQIISDAREDDAFWESPEFDIFALDSVRFYTQKRALLKLVESQAQKIAEQAKEIEQARRIAEEFRDNEYDNDIGLSIAENEILRSEYAKAHPLPWEITDSKEVAR